MTISIPEQYQSLKTKLETIVKKVVSPQEIPANSDLNDYTEAGFYYCKLPNTGLATLSNAPDDVTTGWNGFSLLVENTNVYGNGVKQTLTTFAKSNTFVRNFYTDHTDTYRDTGWKPLYEDTGWQNITFNSGYQNYSSSTPVRYRRIGKVVHLEGKFKNNAATTPGQDGAVFGNITDSTCLPTYEQHSLQQGSGANKFLLAIQPNGNLYWGRYGTTSVSTQADAGAWLHCYTTWFVD